jgi:hypothetical protein
MMGEERVEGLLSLEGLLQTIRCKRTRSVQLARQQVGSIPSAANSVSPQMPIIARASLLTLTPHCTLESAGQ